MRNRAGKVVSPIHFDGAMMYLRSMIDRVVVVWLVLLMFPVGIGSTWAQGLGERINLSGYGVEYNKNTCILDKKRSLHEAFNFQ